MTAAAVGSDDVEISVGKGDAFGVGIAIGIFVPQRNARAENNGRAVDREKLGVFLFVVRDQA
jgi:hypothetical protein